LKIDIGPWKEKTKIHVNIPLYPGHFSTQHMTTLIWSRVEILDATAGISVVGSCALKIDIGP
jgi:hypothetical protein